MFCIISSIFCNNEYINLSVKKYGVIVNEVIGANHYKKRKRSKEVKC